MSTLGLDGRPEEQDNIFQRIFWPSNHAGAADALGQQGFWVCVIVAVVSAGVSVFTGHPLIGLLVFGFYWLGGMGVREHSIAAAIIVTLGYIAALVFAVSAGHFPGLLDIAITIILLANIRGTYIASSWKAKGDPELFPGRMNVTFLDRLVDQLPPKVWPKGRYAFFCLSAVYGTLLVLGTIGILMRPAHQSSQQEIQLQVPASTQ